MTHLLIADDDEAILEALDLVFTEEGYAVTTAQSGREVLDVLGASPEPYVVLSDWKMPEGDGARILDAITADPSLTQGRVVAFMTAATGSAISGIHEILETHHIPVLVKPFELDDLLTFVDALQQQIAPLS